MRCCRHAPPQVIGHMAAARTSAKLNLISSRIFPLPAGVSVAGSPVGQGAGSVHVAAGPAAVDACMQPAAAAGNGSAAQCGNSGDAGVQGQQNVDREEQQQQQQQQRAAGGAPSKPGGSDGMQSSCLLTVRNVSVASWRAAGPGHAGDGTGGGRQSSAEPAAPAAAGLALGRRKESGDAATGARAQLVVEAVESFAALAPGGRFDAAAVQAEVQQQRTQLAAQLDLLRQQQEQGMLPGPEQLAAAGDGSEAYCRCTQNCVAPPPPPPLLQPPPAALQQRGLPAPTFAGHALQQPQLAAPVHQHVASLLPLQHEHAAVMRPLYLQPQQPAWHPQWQLPPGVPGVLPGSALLLPHTAPQPWHAAQAAGDAAAAVVGGHSQALLVQPPLQPAPLAPNQPAPGPASAEQQVESAAAVSAASNKRAAEGLRARLQGSKRSRQQSAAAGGPAAAAQQPEDAERQPEQQPAQLQAEDGGQQREGCQPDASAGQRLPAWLEGAPACLQQLASGGAGAGGRGGGSGARGGPEVLFLGTGSAEPSKYRGASAIQLR